MKKTHLVLLWLLVAWVGVPAQNAPAPASAIAHVTLGSAFVPLTGPWKFHTGDNLAWADPNFDDSNWGAMDLASSPGAVDPNSGARGYVPGWTARGYPGYSGYAWYRLRVNIVQENTADTSHPAEESLAIRMPNEFDDAYQVFVNGQRIGQFGRFTKHGVTYYESQPRAFPLPGSLRSDVPVTIAIRIWMDVSTPLGQRDAGGLHGPPVLGQTSAVQAQLGMYWNALDRRESSIILSIAINLLALLVAFGLYWLDRSEMAYLWLGLMSVFGILYVIVILLEIYTTWISGPSAALLINAVGDPLGIGLAVLFWAYWFRVGHLRRLHCYVWGLVVLLGVGTAMRHTPLYGRVVPVHAIVWLAPLTLVLKLLLGALLVWVTYRGIRKNKAEGWLALPAVLLVAVSLYWPELVATHLLAYFFLFGVFFPLGLIANYASLGIIVVLMLRRFLQSQRQREQWKQEMEQARQVQSLLVPVTPPNTPGFAVESVYLPAQKVGGDFFHVAPGEDGSLLIVMGDVSGKGLKAAMTVSTIVGALRNEKARQSADVLQHLNGVLHGQITGFVTCCAALIAADGTMTIANAGHLAPYRNGKEMTVEGGLPLGIVAEGSYQETRYPLAAGDRLTFISDGVVEATNEKKELFGFERVQAISDQPAQDIAAAAQAFGQEDDISVLSVTRTASLTAVPA